VSFKELGLDESLLQAVTDLGFEEPTIIQEKAITALLSENHDLVGLAQTGTGKTAAFGLPLLQKVDENSKKVQGLILSPTRELCVQISDDLARFAKYKKVKNVAIYGGASIDKQILAIKKGVQIVVATPGRLSDLIKRNVIDLSEVEVAILDEADEMLNMGFKDELDFILGQTPNEKQTWLFSATMPSEVRRIASSYMNNPVEISSGKANKTNENIEHQFVYVNHKVRYEALKRVMDFNPEIFAVVFCRTKIETQEVADKLTKDGYNSDALHGDLSQAQRDRVMAKFRDNTLSILVATDVAARGIDVNDVTHVIHYQLPEEVENYTHRSGRTARAGKTGVSIALVGPKDKYKINQLEKITGAKFTEIPAPTAEEICEKKLVSFGNELKKTEIDSSMDKYISKLNEMFDDVSKEDLIKKIASSQMKQLLEYYGNKKDLGSGAGEGSERNSKDYDRYFMNLGKLDDLTHKDIKELLGDHLGLSVDSIGSTEIKDSFSFFEYKKGNVELVEAISDKLEYNGRTIRVELTKDKPRDRDSRGGGSRNGGFGSGGGRFNGGGNRGGGERRNFGGGDRNRGGSSSGGGYRSENRSDSRSDARPSGERRDYGSSNRSGGDAGSSRGPRREGGSSYGSRDSRSSGSSYGQSREGGNNASSDRTPRKRTSGGSGGGRSSFQDSSLTY
jgi:ATP-dependent RNA helicase DeaD